MSLLKEINQEVYIKTPFMNMKGVLSLDKSIVLESACRKEYCHLHQSL